MENYKTKKVVELKEICKKRGLKGYSNYRKNDLIELLIKEDNKVDSFNSNNGNKEEFEEINEMEEIINEIKRQKKLNNFDGLSELEKNEKKEELLQFNKLEEIFSDNPTDKDLITVNEKFDELYKLFFIEKNEDEFENKESYLKYKKSFDEFTKNKNKNHYLNSLIKDMLKLKILLSIFEDCLLIENENDI